MNLRSVSTASPWHAVRGKPISGAGAINEAEVWYCPHSDNTAPVGHGRGSEARVSTGQDRSVNLSFLLEEARLAWPMNRSSFGGLCHA